MRDKAPAVKGIACHWVMWSRVAGPARWRAGPGATRRAVGYRPPPKYTERPTSRPNVEDVVVGSGVLFVVVRFHA